MRSVQSSGIQAAPFTATSSDSSVVEDLGFDSLMWASALLVSFSESQTSSGESVGTQTSLKRSAEMPHRTAGAFRLPRIHWIKVFGQSHPERFPYDSLRDSRAELNEEPSGCAKVTTELGRVYDTFLIGSFVC